MKKLTPYISILFIILGTILLWATHIHESVHHNSILIIGLLFILAGIIIHIWNIKHESKY